MKSNPTPDADWLLERYRFDFDAGRIFSKRLNREVATYVGSGGYKVFNLGERGRFLAHRILWKARHGEDAPEEIDHINGNPSDNRAVNLRAVDGSQNQWNARRGGVFRGVTLDRQRNKWIAKIARRRIGRFSCFGEAVRARMEAEREMGEIVRR